ncbi:transcriptional regulator, GntR family [Jiangella sp. DSM 45060]|nr:transcriptional regulator, GntR family [Jiangella sp. DSM 45060]
MRPAYQRVADSLRADIEAGRWQPSTKLPSEHTLAQTFEVSRTTIRQALDVLESANVIRRQQGKGTFVAAQGVSHVLGDLKSFTDTLRELGKQPGIRDVSVAIDDDPPADAATFLRGSRIWCVERVRTADGRAFCRMQSWLPDALAAGIAEDELLARQSLYALLADLADERPAEATEVIRAEAASAEDSVALGVPKDTPLLSIYRWTSNHRGAPIEFVRSASPGDRYEYVIRLKQ